MHLSFTYSLLVCIKNVSKVPGIISWSLVVVVIAVPSQAAACDTAGVLKTKHPVLSPFSNASLLSLVICSGSSRVADQHKYQSVFSFSIASHRTAANQTARVTHLAGVLVGARILHMIGRVKT